MVHQFNILRRNNSNLNIVYEAVASYESAACWATTTKFGKFAEVTDTASNNISFYYVWISGRIYLILPANGSGTGPIDKVVSKNKYYAYTLYAGNYRMQEYSRTPIGGSRHKGSFNNLPICAAGQATF